SDWLKSQPKMYPVDPDPYVGLTTGSDDLVTIKDVKVQVFRRAPAATVTLVQCNYGGGFSPGYLIVVDTVRQRTEFRSSDAADVYHDMPPGSISLHGLDHDSATIVFASQEKYLYEGMVTVT